MLSAQNKKIKTPTNNNKLKKIKHTYIFVYYLVCMGKRKGAKKATPENEMLLTAHCSLLTRGSAG